MAQQMDIIMGTVTDNDLNGKTTLSRFMSHIPRAT